jgi:hypothetical protein
MLRAAVLLSFLRRILRTVVDYSTLLPWPDRQDRQHLRSPESTGCLLRGLLAVTTVGLSPTSKRQLSGHTSELLSGGISDDHD